jgi:hypothetical protein
MSEKKQAILSTITLSKKGKTLVCPLNWGLGHATRCIPIIRHLLAEGVEVIIAADGYPLELLRQEFPQLETIEFPSFPISYGNDASLVKTMLRQLPTILKGIEQEHKTLQKIMQQHGIRQVISDNRFGLWNRHVHSIYMTHQLMIKMPAKYKWLEPLVHQLHRWIITRYNECWIPDEAEKSGLSGDLAHKYPLPKHAKFIGTLSRFSSLLPVEKNTTYETLAVLSGPEPQRSILEGKLLNYLHEQNTSALIVRGLPSGEKGFITHDNVSMCSHLSAQELLPYLLGAKTILCRSGYSSVMDLVAIDRTALLIPTPGQTEQEYLAEYLSDKGFEWKRQEEIRAAARDKDIIAR